MDGQMIGRPRKIPCETGFDETELYLTLASSLPEKFMQNQAINIAILSEFMKVSRMTIYRMFQASKLSPRAAKKIVEISEGRIAKTDLIPFVLG
jgi:hypothetical protein